MQFVGTLNFYFIISNEKEVGYKVTIECFRQGFKPDARIRFFGYPKAIINHFFSQIAIIPDSDERVAVKMDSFLVFLNYIIIFFF